ncbi:MAG: hypothetical protein AB1488_06300 [Nitrospirota bacterium]
MEDYINIARKIFSGTRYEASEEDIERLAYNMTLLKKRGLDNLNQRLINSGRGVWATIAEHNFAVMLVSQYPSSVPISYEPGIEARRPPDLKVEIENITYWIQIKDLSKLERENRQDKLIQQIKAKAKEIKVGRFFSCILSDDFKEDYLPELIDFMKDKAASADEGKSFLFTGQKNQKVKIEFWSPGKIALSELTLGYAGDLEILEITGLSKEQIKQSLINAAGAFNWEADKSNINLTVMEADNKEDIDICDALFGTEFEIIDSEKQTWSRKNDGLLNECDFRKKVAGVIAIKRKEKWRPVSDYNMILYMNNSFKHLLSDITKLFNFDMVVYNNMRPRMGHGNFEL